MLGKHLTLSMTVIKTDKESTTVICPTRTWNWLTNIEQSLGIWRPNMDEPDVSGQMTIASHIRREG